MEQKWANYNLSWRKKKTGQAKGYFSGEKDGKKKKKLGSYIYKYKNLFQIDQRPK